MSPSQPILVLGMHRSGTSALARVLGLMGADIGEPDELLPTHPIDNPTGYWERSELNTVHDRMLAEAGYRWDRVAGFESGSLDDEAVQAPLRKLELLVRRLEATGGPWLVKDPRLCLLLSRWLPLVERPACVVMVRDPREIAASMSNGPRGVFTSRFVIELWEKYLRTMLRDLGGRPALFVSYADLLADPAAQCERLLRGMREFGVAGLHDISPEHIAGFLDPKLKRSVPPDHAELSPSQSALHRWLLDGCAAPGAITASGFPDEAAADTELAEFEAAFDYHFEHGRGQATIDTNARLAAIEALLAEHRGERERWQQERAAQEQRLEESRHALAEAERERDAGNATVAAQQERLSVLEPHASGLETAVQAMRSSWSWKLTAPVRWIAGLVSFRMNFDSEQRIYRFFYSLPGMNVARKRAMIVWLHEHASWMTRHTLSYQLYQQAKQLIDQQQNNREYRARLQRMDERRAASLIAEMHDLPLISIVVPVYNVERRWLMAAVESVRRQFYPRWELCLADDASTRTETQQALRDIAALGDERIRIQTLPKNLGIAGASNAALAMATGEYVGLLDNDDELSRDALLEMARCIDRDHPDFLYSDEDKINENGFHVEPHFKPDFSPDFLASTNYICHFSVVRRELLNRIGGFRAGFDGAQDYDLVLRICEQTDNIVHIPLVLYHWRRIEGSTSATASAKPQTDDAGRRALAESLQRRGIEATAEAGPAPNTYRVRHAIRGNPRVSIIIPFRDKPELLDVCVSSIIEKTRYANFEILLIDNGSAKAATQSLLTRLQARDDRVRVIRHDVPFNYSNIINFSTTQASGEHLLFLNNDTKVIGSEWLEAMLEHSQRPDVGVVGAKLLYEDDTVQHAGVIVGLGGVAGHSHLFASADDPGYFRRAQLIQNLSAVTFACAMTRREVFERVGGLNERDLKIAFNDVDYCLRVREAGYRIVYTPFALLYHFESKSRGQDDTPEKKMRFDSEIRYFQKRHATILTAGDPYYNPNLTVGQQNFAPMPEYVHQLPL